MVRRQPVHYTSNDEENLAFVEAAAAAEFGISPRRVAQGTWWHTYLPAPYHCTHGRGNPLHAWFRELGIEDLRSHEKRLPAAMYGASDAEVCLFLRHLWATDGCVWLGRGKSANKVYYATSSRELAYGVVHLLARLGIVARVRQVEKAGYQPELPRHHGRRSQTCEPSASASEFTADAAKRREKLATALAGRTINTNVDTIPIGVWDVVKAERIRAGLDRSSIPGGYRHPLLRYHALQELPVKRTPHALRGGTRLRDVARDRPQRPLLGPDSSIEPLGPQPVYDATVKGTHNFIADGLVSHNSIEQDSDVVILLHREDAYERESPRAGEADLIVAKHRNGPTATVTVAFQGHYSRFVDMASP